MYNVLNTNDKLEDIFSNLYSVIYVDLNTRDGNIEDFIDLNIHQLIISEISLYQYVRFELVTSLEHFGTVLSSGLFNVYELLSIINCMETSSISK